MLDMSDWLFDVVMPNHNEIVVEDCRLQDVPRDQAEWLAELDRIGANHNEIVLAG